MALIPTFRRLYANFGLRISIPAILILAATIGTVLFSLSRMAHEANHIEDALTERSTAAAVATFVRSIGESHGDYARWDDAVRALYGNIDFDFVEQNFVASTAAGTFFDTVYLLDADGSDLFGYRSGEKVNESSSVAFGSPLKEMLAKLASDGHTYGLESGMMRTAWGLAAVAVGPVVGNTVGFENPASRSRMLVIAKAFDETAIQRLGTNYVIDNLRLTPADSAEGVAISDPTGSVIGRLAWNDRALGSEARERVGPIALAMLGLLAITMGALIFLAQRGVREIQKRETASRFAATHDSLTGLANRGAFLSAVESALKAAYFDDVPCALAYMDLDGFKQVNDAYGHAAGDEVLKVVAMRLQTISNDHLLARLGGDEFALLITGRDAKKEARAFGHGAISLLRAPFELDHHVIAIGICLGLATGGERELSAEEFLRRGDAAMYQAKQSGPNRYFVYDAAIDRLRHEKIALTEDLTSALADGQLSVSYQPIVSSASGEIVAAEALLRWTHPTRGDVSPSVFIPVAEETGLIEAIGAWVLRQACSDGLAWGRTRVSVNVSPAQFRNPTFAGFVASVLKDTGFAPERLQLEITETYLLAHPEQARVAIDELSRLGVSVVLDDFGTGYSSIGYLRRFKFDKLKLDRSLIADIVTDVRIQRLVHATIALAEALSLTVTAEGVETEGEAVLLQAAGCHELQGFLYSQPISASQLGKLLNRQGHRILSVVAA